MPDRKRREQFRFELGGAVAHVATEDLAKLACAHLDLAKAALMDSERRKALARIDAAHELLMELRDRGEQLRLRI